MENKGMHDVYAPRMRHGHVYKGIAKPAQARMKIKSHATAPSSQYTCRVKDHLAPRSGTQPVRKPYSPCEAPPRAQPEQCCAVNHERMHAVLSIFCQLPLHTRAQSYTQCSLFSVSYRCTHAHSHTHAQSRITRIREARSSSGATLGSPRWPLYEPKAAAAMPPSTALTAGE